MHIKINFHVVDKTFLVSLSVYLFKNSMSSDVIVQKSYFNHFQIDVNNSKVIGYPVFSMFSLTLC